MEETKNAVENVTASLHSHLETLVMASVRLGLKPNKIFWTRTFSKDLHASLCSIAVEICCLPNLGLMKGL